MLSFCSPFVPIDVWLNIYFLQVDKDEEIILQSEPEFRPLMSEVVQDLQRVLQKGSPNKSKNGD